MKLAAIIASLLLAGCASSPTFMWTHDSHNDRAQFDRDAAQCKYEATAATASYSSGPTARTYGGAISQGISDGINIGSRQVELAVLCMKARGYSQKPIETAKLIQ